jgi:hypothetical protein
MADPTRGSPVKQSRPSAVAGDRRRRLHQVTRPDESPALPDARRPAQPRPRATATGDAPRTPRVRDASSSPFWPFVLATTPAGQEGFDFHSYCHVCVHWNLPANPVDPEQREDDGSPAVQPSSRQAPTRYKSEGSNKRGGRALLSAPPELSRSPWLFREPLAGTTVHTLLGTPGHLRAWFSQVKRMRPAL